jgi:hypothetical protein
MEHSAPLDRDGRRTPTRSEERSSDGGDGVTVVTDPHGGVQRALKVKTARF